MTQEKITLEEICAYLPYGVKVQHTFYGERNEVFIDTIESVCSESLSFEIGRDYYFKDPEPDSDIKLILHPLESIFEKEDFKGLELNISDLQYMSIFNKNYPCKEILRYNQMQLLFKHHIDVFNLIGRGLAIDVNTIK